MSSGSVRSVGHAPHAHKAHPAKHPRAKKTGFDGQLSSALDDATSPEKSDGTPPAEMLAALSGIINVPPIGVGAAGLFGAAGEDGTKHPTARPKGDGTVEESRTGKSASALGGEPTTAARPEAQAHAERPDAPASAALPEARDADHDVAPDLRLAAFRFAPPDEQPSTASTHAKLGRTDIDALAAQAAASLKSGKRGQDVPKPEPSAVGVTTGARTSDPTVKTLTTAGQGAASNLEEAVKNAETAGHRRVLAGGEAHGHVTVPEIGRVEVHAQTVAAANVAVHVHADDAHGRAVLAAHAPELRADVQAEVPSAQVYLDRGNSGNHDRRRSPSEHSDGGDARGRADGSPVQARKRQVRGRARFVL